MICPRCQYDNPDDAVYCCHCARALQHIAPSRIHQRASGTGTAIKRNGSKLWTADVTIGWRVDDDGKKHRIRVRKGGFKTRAEALAHCSEMLANKRTKKAPTLGEYWESYSSAEMELLSESKRVAYKIAWTKLKTIEFRLVDSLTVADLRRVVTDNAKTYYPARDMKVLLTHLFKLAAADGWVSKDLPTFIVLPANDEAERIPFTDEEQKSLWKAYESGVTDAAIPLIMIYTGMMTGEMRALTADMIDFENRRIVGVGLKTKVRKESPVYLPTAILPVLQDISSGVVGLIYPCGKHTFYDRYYAALEAAEVRPLSPYSCRHTTATALAITEGVAPQTVKKIMRWSTTKMLDRYAHPDDADAIAAMDRLRRADQ